MCEPTTVLTLSTLAMDTYAKMQEAADQAASINDGAIAQAGEKGKMLQQQAGERAAEARRNRSRMIVAAGESGIGLNSQSFEAELANNFGRENRDLAILRDNAETQTKGIEANRNIALSNVQSPLQILTGAALGSSAALAGRPPGPAGSSSSSGSGLLIPVKAPYTNGNPHR